MNSQIGGEERGNASILLHKYWSLLQTCSLIKFSQKTPVFSGNPSLTHLRLSQKQCSLHCILPVLINLDCSRLRKRKKPNKQKKSPSGKMPLLDLPYYQERGTQSRETWVILCCNRQFWHRIHPWDSKKSPEVIYFFKWVKRRSLSLSLQFFIRFVPARPSRQETPTYPVATTALVLLLGQVSKAMFSPASLPTHPIYLR